MYFSYVPLHAKYHNNNDIDILYDQHKIKNSNKAYISYNNVYSYLSFLLTFIYMLKSIINMYTYTTCLGCTIVNVMNGI